MIKCKVNNIECSQCTPCCGNRIELKNIDLRKVPKEEQVEKVVEEFQELNLGLSKNLGIVARIIKLKDIQK